jgi:hypothetical protein
VSTAETIGTVVASWNYGNNSGNIRGMPVSILFRNYLRDAVYMWKPLWKFPEHLGGYYGNPINGNSAITPYCFHYSFRYYSALTCGNA